MQKNIAVALIWGHGIIATLHGLAHLQLGIFQAPLNTLYVVMGIGAAPFVALWLLRRDHDRAGAALLMLSMLGALLYGLVYHFLHESPDHIAHLPAGNPLPFQVTALAILLLEGLGVVVGGGLWQSLQRPQLQERYYG